MNSFFLYANQLNEKKIIFDTLNEVNNRLQIDMLAKCIPELPVKTQSYIKQIMELSK